MPTESSSPNLESEFRKAGHNAAAARRAAELASTGMPCRDAILNAYREQGSRLAAKILAGAFPIDPPLPATDPLAAQPAPKPPLNVTREPDAAPAAGPPVFPYIPPAPRLDLPDLHKVPLSQLLDVSQQVLGSTSTELDRGPDL